MKSFKVMIVALVAVFSFISCEQHDCIEIDYSNDLVGTWTCLQANFAEALIISADGSAVSTGVEDGEYWENINGHIEVRDGRFIMTSRMTTITRGNL